MLPILILDTFARAPQSATLHSYQLLSTHIPGSDIPNWVTMARAIRSTCCKSPPAPVVTCEAPKTSCSATRPPKAPAIRAWDRDDELDELKNGDELHMFIRFSQLQSSEILLKRDIFFL